MAKRFYGSVNDKAEEVVGFYAPIRPLVSVTGAISQEGIGNVTVFDNIAFVDHLETKPTGYVEVAEGSLTLTGIEITATATYYTAKLLFDGGKEIPILASGSDQLTRQNLYTWGISAPAISAATEGTDTIEIVATYGPSYSKDVIKGYCSVNGVSKLFFRKVYGHVIYYTDRDNTQTDDARIYSLTEFNQLCNGGDEWNATIDGKTFANTKIKEVHLKLAVKEIQTGFCRGCTELTDVTLPPTVTYIGQYFLDNCHKFNSPLNLGQVTFIGSYFMHECDDFNQPLTIPSTVQSIGVYFMYRCNSLIEPITVECPASVISYDDHNLSTLVMSVPAYQTGHTLTGTYAQEWKDKFPDRGTFQVPYRKLLLQ